MWEKLIDLIIGKWLELQTPERKTARSLVTLLSNLRNCQEAYLLYSEETTEEKVVEEWEKWSEREKEWEDQVEALVLSHSALHEILDAFAPEANIAISAYVSSEVVFFSDRKDLKRNLREAIETYTRRAKPDEHRVAFDRACEKLREFIQKNYKPEDAIRI